MGQHGLDHLCADRQHWVEGHHRILENHRDPRPAQCTHALRRNVGQVFALEQNLACNDMTG